MKKEIKELAEIIFENTDDLIVSCEHCKNNNICDYENDCEYLKSNYGSDYYILAELLYKKGYKKRTEKNKNEK